MKFIPEKPLVMDFLPRNDNESNLKYRFCKACEQYGLKFFMQYPSKWNEAPGIRFDVVIHNDKYILALVEIKKKRDGRKTAHKWINTNQCKKYLSFGRPVFLVYDETDFADVFNYAYDLESQNDVGPILK